MTNDQCRMSKEIRMTNDEGLAEQLRRASDFVIPSDFVICHSSLALGSSLRMTRAGLPTATENAGTSAATTDRAPITAPSPIVTPGRMQQSNPIQTFFAIRIGEDDVRAEVWRGLR